MPAMIRRGQGQRVSALRGKRILSLDLPGAEEELLPGIPWGSAAAFFTPAYWKAQAWFNSVAGVGPRSHRIGTTLREEVAACLLGGYGIPAEVGLAAFRLIRQEGLLRSKRGASREKVYQTLSGHLRVNGRTVRYRFAHQKSGYLAAALDALDRGSPPEGSDLAFRDYFLSLPGFGPKTASWLTRNWLGSDRVAVLDVHVIRAGVIAGVFERRRARAQDYREMELRFLGFAEALGVRASVLDALIWGHMRKGAGLARMLVEGSN
jgi:thermostable 8-oxoguanine DNA glycosylase